MSQPDAPTVTRPARKRAPVKVSKPAAAAPAAKPKTVVDRSEDGKTKYAFAITESTTTANYQKFALPADSGCVGTVYAPLGTEEIRILLIGPADAH